MRASGECRSAVAVGRVVHADLRHDHHVIDCIVVGAGHNGLVTAAYLARSGYSILVLEANSSVGGAAVSAEVFPGMGARVSKYSYLVSLLPPAIARGGGALLVALGLKCSSSRPTRLATPPAQVFDDMWLYAVDDAAHREGSGAHWRPIHFHGPGRQASGATRPTRR